MATAASVKAKLQRLIDGANATTGATDTTLAAAVNTLKSGYGSSGGSCAYETPHTFTYEGKTYLFIPGQTWNEWMNYDAGCNRYQGDHFVAYYGSVSAKWHIGYDEENACDIANCLTYNGSYVDEYAYIQAGEYGTDDAYEGI